MTKLDGVDSASDALQSQKELAESLIRSSIDGILAFDRECRYTIWNPGMERISGVKKEDALGRLAFDVFPFLKEVGEDENFYEALAGKTVFAVDRPFNVPETGRSGYFEAHYSPLCGASGEIIGGLAIIHDSTERHLTEQALRESEHKYRIVVEQASDGIAIYDRQGTILDVNEQACKIGGWAREELLGKNVVEVIAPEDLAATPLRWDQLSSGQSALGERVLVRKDGTRLPVELSARMLTDGTVQTILRDITERKQVEKEIRRARDFYLTLLEDFPALIWRAGTDGKCDYFNRTWLTFTGRMLEHEVGNGWMQDVHPADLDSCVSKWLECFEARQPFSLEYRLRRYDGEYRWMVDYGAPIYDLEGEFTGYLGSCYDVTEAHRSEEAIRQLNAELEQRVAARTAQLEAANQALHREIAERQRLEVQKDEFLAVASHELRTPITVIKGYTKLALNRAVQSGDQKLARTLQIVDEKSDQLTRLIGDMLDISRIENGRLALERQRVDLGPLVRHAAGGLRLTSPDFTISTDVQSEPIFVDADPQRVEQVLANLVDNAVKYTRKDGAVQKKVEIHVYLDGSEAITAVRDYGVGIPSEQQEQVFGRFFRADNVSASHYPYPGMGLGLFIAHTAVTMHGGRMWVESKEGEGSTFYFSLPLAKEE